MTAFLGDFMQSISQLEVLASTAMFIRRSNTTKANPSHMCDKGDPWCHVNARVRRYMLPHIRTLMHRPLLNRLFWRGAASLAYIPLPFLGNKSCCAQLLLESTEPINQCVNLALTWSLFILISWLITDINLNTIISSFMNSWLWPYSILKSNSLKFRNSS